MRTWIFVLTIGVIFILISGRLIKTWNFENISNDQVQVQDALTAKQDRKDLSSLKPDEGETNMDFDFVQDLQALSEDQISTSQRSDLVEADKANGQTSETVHRFQKRIDDLVARERRQFFKSLVNELRENLSNEEVAVVLVEIRNLMETNSQIRQELKHLLLEVVQLHKEGGQQFFEKASEYRKKRLSYYRDLSVSLRDSLYGKNFNQESLDKVIAIFESNLEKQRIIF
ncbi:MAG: hypothetical protein NZO16_00585 [Deltaproteobacteria bacterium]|nr:hypothetical protein [Deltaproteobacteria bacterium]